MLGFPLSNFTWLKGNDTESIAHLKELTNVTHLNETHVTMSLKFESVNRRDNGTYTCKANDYHGPIMASTSLFVIDVPQVSIDFMKAVGAGKIYLNWTTNDGNMPIERYFIQHLKQGTDQWSFYAEEIDGRHSNYVLKGFENGTAYQLRIIAKNAIGSSQTQTDPRWITTLKEGIDDLFDVV